MSPDKQHRGEARATAVSEVWPALPLKDWQATYNTLHMWTQIVGKIRLARAPMINHWWQVPLYVTARGLTTSPMPFGHRTAQFDFDFIEHRLLVNTSDGAQRALTLAPRSVADFYRALFATLASLGLAAKIWPVPVEVPDPTRFDRDRQHASYDPDHAHRHWQILVQADRVLTQFRSRFIGKVSPVHFFWGSFDLAVTRFSGRPAPEHPSSPLVADYVVREAYSHEVSSCGFWPGGGPVSFPAFYAYAYPEPPAFRDAIVRPAEASYHPELQEFLLPYDAVRAAVDPDQMLLDFFQSTYEATANLGGWDRGALERK